MTMPSDITVIETGTAAADSGSYVDWPAIIAGIVLASAISLVLLTFGAAIGLSFTDFNARDDVSPVWVAIAAASWLLWVQVSSFMAGAYLTGRLRKRWNDASEEEVDVRDGSHGVLVWAGALVVGAVIAAGGIGAAASAIGSAASTVTTAASNVAGDAAEAVDPNAYFIDLLFRPSSTGAADDADSAAAEPAATEPAGTAATTTTTTTTTPAATTTAPAATTEPAPTQLAATDPAALDAARGEVGRIFLRSTDGTIEDADRTYLAQLVARQTGMSDEEAATRVDEVNAAMQQAATEAAEAAEAARRTAVIGAFITAASLLVSAAGAFWAAQKGGNHRDENTSFAGDFRRL